MGDDAPANILVVDDRVDNLAAIEGILRPLEQNVVCVTSGEAALERLLRESYAVILLDVQMPGMDGFETAAYIKSRPGTGEIPIIFVTAVGDEHRQIQRGYSVGAVDYVLKPFDPDVLRSKVCVFVELHKTSRELARRTAELERSNKALAEFAYAASHDLVEPARTISGFADVLDSRYADQLGEEGSDLVRQIAWASTRMQTLIDDLLDYSLAGGDLRPSEFDLDEALDEVAAALRNAFDRNDAVLVRDRLPVVWGDRKLLGQVLQNLLANALKFAAPNPRIEVEGTERDEGWLITVTDNGRGVDPEDRERIFTVFQRGDVAVGHDGSGIGLAICRRIVEQHEGRIWVEDASGGGARFCVWLPGRRVAGLT